MSTLSAVPLAIVFAAALDWSVGEPPEWLHPVAWFGRIVGALDRRWSRPLATGAIAAIVLPLAAAGTVGLAVAAGAVVHPSAGTLLAGLALFVATSLRELVAAAATVVAATETDLGAAREQLPTLVGRDTTELDAAHVRSAAVESLAENLSDGLVAPLLAFSLLAPTSLAAGASAATWVKAVNTMDSMLGYPDRPVGTAAAKLDDAVMWLPARLTALLLAVAAGSPEHVLAARRWADATASPNAGWPMATTASALDVRLEKPDAYDLHPSAPFPDVGDARRGIRLVGRAGLLAYALAALSGVVAWAS